jgi:uncharacterized membrane protein YiaA
MEENLIDNSDLRRERPAFLAVLCILTWIGSALVTLVNAGAAVMLWYINQKVYADWQILSLMAFVAGSVICTVGAMHMWKLRKRGYYIYLIGQLLPMALLLVDILSKDLTKLHWLKFFTLIGWIVVPVAFTMMYSRNLKHLR